MTQIPIYLDFFSPQLPTAGQKSSAIFQLLASRPSYVTGRKMMKHVAATNSQRSDQHTATATGHERCHTWAVRIA